MSAFTFEYINIAEDSRDSRRQHDFAYSSLQGSCREAVVQDDFLKCFHKLERHCSEDESSFQESER